jgi:flagellar biosynthesis/type III secretory pathway protein FliH
MISVIKAARAAEVGIPLHSHPQRLRQAAATTASAAQAEVGKASASHPDVMAAKPPQESAAEVAAYGPPVPDASYAEGYEDGHAEGSREGYRRGHEEGLQEGIEQERRAARDAEEARDRWIGKLANAIGAACERWEREVEAGAIDIAYAAVLRIIGGAAGNRAMVAALVRGLLEQLPERRLLSLHLSPSDHALLEDDLASLPLCGAAVVADERVDIGGCIIETDAGSLDGRLETQLAGLRDLLLSLHRSGGEAE